MGHRVPYRLQSTYGEEEMTPDELHELKEDIYEKVHELVNSMTGHLSQDEDEELRQELTEQFRFWRQ